MVILVQRRHLIQITANAAYRQDLTLANLLSHRGTANQCHRTSGRMKRNKTPAPADFFEEIKLGNEIRRGKAMRNTIDRQPGLHQPPLWAMVSAMAKATGYSYSFIATAQPYCHTAPLAHDHVLNPYRGRPPCRENNPSRTSGFSPLYGEPCRARHLHHVLSCSNMLRKKGRLPLYLFHPTEFPACHLALWLSHGFRPWPFLVFLSLLSSSEGREMPGARR
jgi:hypothetical protein